MIVLVPHVVRQPDISAGIFAIAVGNAQAVKLSYAPKASRYDQRALPPPPPCCKATLRRPGTAMPSGSRSSGNDAPPAYPRPAASARAASPGPRLRH